MSEVTGPLSSTGPVNMSDTPSGGVVDFGSFTVRSSESAEEIKESITPEADNPTTKAAKELGKRGGEAAAEKRKTEAKEAAKSEEAGDEPEPETEAAPEKSKKGNPRHDPTARVAQATRERREAIERAERAERELEQLRRQAQSARPVEERREAPPKQPLEAQLKELGINPDDYETFGEMNIELMKRLMQREAKRAHERRQAESQAQEWTSRIEKATSSYQEKITKAWPSAEAMDAELSPDVLSLSPSFMLEPGEPASALNGIADEIVNSDYPVEIMRYLSEHEDEFQRIAALRTPRLVAREMAKVEDRALAATTATAQPAQRKEAPKPFRPVRGTPHATASVDDEDLDNMPFERFAQIENKKAREARR